MAVHALRHFGLLVVVGAAVALAGLLAYNRSQGWPDRQALRRLGSADGRVRQEGAALACERDAPLARRLMAERLASGSEPHAGARESYVHTLGLSGDARYFGIVFRVAEQDPDGYVRHASWLAAARLNADRFRAVAAWPPGRPDPWDRVGLAAAWLEVGDFRGLEDLFEFAVRGDENQRRAAALALGREVAPLLEAAGRWPMGFTLAEGEVWPAALVAEVQRRCGAADLAALSRHSGPVVARTAALRRDIGRITATRERIAALLRERPSLRRRWRSGPRAAEL